MGKLDLKLGYENWFLLRVLILMIKKNNNVEILIFPLTLGNNSLFKSIYNLTSAVSTCVDKHRKKYEKLCKS